MTVSERITNQLLLDALFLTAQEADINQFDLIERARLGAIFFDRSSVYSGEPIAALPGLTENEKKSLQRKLIESLVRHQNPSGTTLGHLNLRAGPGVQYGVLQTLLPDIQFSVLAEEGDWVRVQVDGRQGYVHREYVKLPNQPTRNRLLATQPELLRVPLPPPPAFALDTARLAQGTLAFALADLWNRYGGLLAVLANELGIDPGVAVAVLLAESGGRGFAPGPTGQRMIIRFENHIFYDRWGRANPERFNRHFVFASSQSWTGHQWRPDPGAAWREFHGNQENEWQVYEFAAGLDRRAARESISMGLPQVMGFNYLAVGYPHVDAMFDAFASSEARQIFGFFDFVRSKAGISPLRNRDYAGFASIYNGSGQASIYGGIIQERADLFARLWQQKFTPATRGIALESTPSMPAELPSSATDEERVRLRSELIALLAEQKRVLWLQQILLGVGVVTILAGALLAYTGSLRISLLPLLAGMVALLTYLYIHPKMSASFQAQIARLESLLERNESLPF